MAISTAMCTSFKQEILVGTHNFTATTGNTFKLALFTSSASLGASTTAFATTNEVSGTGYSSGGFKPDFSDSHDIWNDCSMRLLRSYLLQRNNHGEWSTNL